MPVRSMARSPFYSGVALFACAFEGLVTVNEASAQVFVETTNAAGVAVVHDPSPIFWTTFLNVANLTGGGAVGDFNNDGFQDIYFISGGSQPDRLFINNGDGTFTDQASAWGVAAAHMGMGAAVGDYNNDGFLDVYVTSLGTNVVITGRHRLYRNNGDGTFTSVAEEAGVNRTSTNIADGFGAAFGDYNLNGHLDLYVNGWILQANGNRLYRNNGDGTFTDVTVAAGVNHQTVRGFSPRFADMNGDGYPELLVAADFGTSRYYINNGDGTFTNATQFSGTGLDDNGMGQAIGDFSNGGRFDWYVTSIYSANSGMPNVPGTGNMLYLNQGGHVYIENSVQAGVNKGGWGWGTVAVDFNNDGLLDIAETNGWHTPNGEGHNEWANHKSYLFMNQGDGTFTERAIQSGFVHMGQGRGLVNLDYDNDGRQDLLVFSYNGPLRLYRNVTPPDGANYLRVFLETSAAPRLAANGVGTRLLATVGTMVMTRMIDAGCSYLGQSELSAHFGLGAAEVVDVLRIEWNDGSVTLLHDVPANQTMTIAAGLHSDLNGDGTVDVMDLLALLASWGECAAPRNGKPGTCAADINADGMVDVHDLLVLLRNWG